ncbi:MAG: hypothetical protein WBV82_09380 [Myxococcaceae bacterium]
MRLALAVAALVFSAACAPRTVIKPGAPDREQQAFVGDGGCNVRDFDSATDLPPGARNLGWVQVPQLETDEATFLELRRKICELGGDALSQAAWEKGPSDEEPSLTAHAWELP